MKTSPLPSATRPNEQRKVEQLLKKLATVKPISARPAPIALEALKTA